MRTKKEIQSKIEEANNYSKECLWMYECIYTGIHPKDSEFTFTTMHDLNAAYIQSMSYWIEKSEVHLKCVQALNWVLKS